jgi:signal transduction histidine kinase
LLIRTEPDLDEQVRVSVEDAGIGFGAQGPDRLFEAFYTTKNDGMGIGLSVSRSIVERYDGRLWAQANDGPGATFAFSIPRWTGGVTRDPGFEGTESNAAGKPVDPTQGARPQTDARYFAQNA